MRRYPLAGDIAPSTFVQLGGTRPNPPRTGDWYVLWRPPVRRESRDAWSEGYDTGQVTLGPWEVYQQNLTRTRAERLARTVSTVLAPRWFGVNVDTKVGQGTPPKDNPPWTTKAIGKQWDDLVEKVGVDWMPALTKAHASKKGELVAQLGTLGCGAYGCVLETGDPQVVLKVTTDSSEAEFATRVLPNASEEARAGFVLYHDSTELDSRHERRPLVALWRQSADDVGKIATASDGVRDRVMGRGGRKELVRLVDHSWSAAQVALEILINTGDDAGDLYDAALLSERWSYDERVKIEDVLDRLEDIDDLGVRLSAALSYFQSVNQAMKGTPLEKVGVALNALLDEGIFVADVHEGNLGRVYDEHGNRVWVITDPGNVIVLPSPWR